MRGLWLFALCLGLGVPLGAARAQDAQTLADIRQELSVLYVEMQRLRRELSTTGGPATSVGGGSVLARMDAIEAELRRLTAQTEGLDLRLQAVVRDGSNRVNDLEFRLCELEPACDIATLGAGSTLGGEVDTSQAPQVPQQPTEGVVVGEQADFDAAKAALDAGDMATAAEGFGRFVETYPVGPLTTQAHVLRGQALAAQSDWQSAARAYLEAFSTAPDGPFAADALLQLGLALSELGQTDEACLTLAEVPLRFPQAAASLQANSAYANLSCP